MTAPPAVLPAPAVDRLEPLRPMPVEAVSGAMRDYQRGLQAILDGEDWQKFTGNDGSPQEFVKRSGWRKIGTWFGLDLQIVSTVIERVAARLCPQCGHQWMEAGAPDGSPLRAQVVGRAIAPNGRVVENIGVASINERRYTKPEHELVGTACTRAYNRATADLVGMGAVSAEEMGDTVAPMLPEWAGPAGEDLLTPMRTKLLDLVGSEERVDAFERAVVERYGYEPNVLTGFVNAMYSMVMPELERCRQTGEQS